jgi:hypothetical protein
MTTFAGMAWQNNCAMRAAAAREMQKRKPAPKSGYRKAHPDPE